MKFTSISVPADVAQRFKELVKELPPVKGRKNVTSGEALIRLIEAYKK